MKLKNKIAIITGGGKGIGKEICLGLAKEGAKIIIADLDTENSSNVVEKIIQNGGDAIYVETNVSSEQSVKNLITKSINKFNQIDILINNAGITQDNLTIRMKDEEWNKVINLNLTSTFLFTKNVIKKMIKNKNGKIINITSIVGHTGNVGQANYAASKSGLIGMSKSLALEYGKKNIKVNCISPGFIKSEMTDKISDNYKKIMEEKISLGRFGSTEDVANAVAFLSSELSDYITGETIHVNGGMYFS